MADAPPSAAPSDDAPKKPRGNGRTIDKPKGPKKAAPGKPNPRVSKTDQRRRGNIALGAPTRLTPEVEQRIIADLTRHVSRRGAFNGAGIDETTGNRWLQWGARYDDGIGPTGTGPRDKTQKPYSDFRRRVLQAEAESERALLNPIRKAAEGELQGRDGTPLAPDWKAALELVRRRHRDQWADKVEVHTTHEDADPTADRIADSVLQNPDLAAELTAALGKITLNLASKKDQEKSKA